MEDKFIFTEPHLEQLHQDTQKIISQLKDFEVLSYQQLNWKPAPTSWSVVECIDHLKVTEALYITKIRQSFEDARIRNLKAQKPFKSAWFGGWFAKQVKPNTRKMKNPSLFSPEIGTLEMSTLTAYIDMKINFLELLETLNGYDIQRMKVTSPITKLMVFRVGDALQILTNHAFRHILQAQRVTQNPNFPKKEL